MSEGWHGPQNLQQWIHWARHRVQRNQHVVLMLCGKTGIGKSSLGLLLSSKLQPDEQPPFDPERQIFFRLAEGMERARTMPKKVPILYDEAISEGGNKRRAMSRVNVSAMDFLNTCRKLNQLHLFCFPFYDDADNAVKPHVQWVFELTQLGKATAYTVDLVGGPKKKGSWLTRRFEFSFPDAAKVAPELWRAYDKRVQAYVRGRPEDKKEQALVAKTLEYAPLVRRSVGERRP